MQSRYDIAFVSLVIWFFFIRWSNTLVLIQHRLYIFIVICHTVNIHDNADRLLLFPSVYYIFFYTLSCLLKYDGLTLSGPRPNLIFKCWDTNANLVVVFKGGKWQILAIAVKLSTVIKWHTTLKIKVPSNLKCSSHRSMGKKILGRTYYNIRLKVKYPRHYCPHKTYFNEAVTIFFLLSLGKTINSSAEIRQTTAIKVKSIIRKEATLHHAKKQVHQFHHEFQ